MPAVVFPAHAGMSHTVKTLGFWCLCFPRSRGDEPSRFKIVAFAWTFSPLTRG